MISVSQLICQSTPAQQDLFDQLLVSNFCLCGSRYFHIQAPDLIPISNETDWDFCGEYNEANLNLLTTMGFDDCYPQLGMLEVSIATLSGDQDLIKVTSAAPYTDSTAVTILKHSQHSVEVVLRRGVVQYMAMLESVAPEFFRDYLWKSGPNTPARDNIRAIINQLQRTYTT